MAKRGRPRKGFYAHKIRQHGRKWRFRVPPGYGENGGQYCTYETYQGARAGRQRMLRQWGEAAQTVGEMIERWHSQRVVPASKRRQYADHARTRVAIMLAPIADRSIHDVTPIDVKRCYDAARGRVTIHGRPPSNATTAGDLAYVRQFFAWLCEPGIQLLAVNPAQRVRAVGKRPSGKKQLRIHEARRLYAQLTVDVTSDDLIVRRRSIYTLCLLQLGIRKGEIDQATVREIEPDGSVLYIDDGKTAASARPVFVPRAYVSPLRSVLASWRAERLAADGPDALMFGGAAQTTTRRWVRRCCEAAGVPVVTPHSFRGLFATTALRGGAVAEQVSAAIAHADTSMTFRYAEPGSHEHGARGRRLDLLTGAESLGSELANNDPNASRVVRIPSVSATLPDKN